MMTPNRPPAQYSADNEAQYRQTMAQADARNLKFGQDIAGSRLILRSPNGAGWVLTVDNSGALSTVAL